MAYKVALFVVLDVDPRISHIRLGSVIACLVAVGVMTTANLRPGSWSRQFPGASNENRWYD